MTITKLSTYQNGNYTVSIYSDGTKIRENDYDYFEAAFPENIDVKITNYCNKGCPYCHENSTTEGEHGNILNYTFLNSLHPYTELAIGGGNPLAHPQIEEFLITLKERNIIANLTVNQAHFMHSVEYLKELVDRELVHGIGVSLTNKNNILKYIDGFDNLVVHTISGLCSVADYNLLRYCSKVLILGYKNFGRGKDFYSENILRNQQAVKERILDIISWYDVISFDNLAIEQLDLKNQLDEKVWNQFYMGDDGKFTFYVDLVKNEFAKNSTSTVRYPMNDLTVDEMFQTIKEM
jgi:hypothetical protein